MTALRLAGDVRVGHAAAPRPSRTGAGFARVGLGCVCAAIAFLVVSLRPAVPLLSLALLLVGVILAFRTTLERSVAVGYAAFIVVSFVAAPMVKGPLPSTTATVWLLLALWFAGWSLGQYLMGRLSASADARRRPSDQRPLEPLHRSAVLLVGILSLIVQFLLVRAGDLGYGVQVRGDVSIGPLAIFSSVGPAALASAYATTVLHRASLERRVLVTALVLLQAVALAATGFKGAGPTYLLIVWLVVRRWRPPTRLRPRRVGVAALAVVVMLVLFEFAANVRRDIASATTTQTRSSGLAAVVETPALALKRLDLLASAHPAIERADRPDAKMAVSVESQLVAYVPRTLWPNKPITSYGQEVSVVFFDIPAFYRTSSSITWIGDLFVQGGPTLIVLVAILVGAAFNRALRWRMRLDPVSVACHFLAVQVLLTLESPLLMSLATALRTLLTLMLAMYGARLVLKIARGRRRPMGVVYPQPGRAMTIG